MVGNMKGLTHNNKPTEFYRVFSHLSLKFNQLYWHEGSEILYRKLLLLHWSIISNKFTITCKYQHSFSLTLFSVATAGCFQLKTCDQLAKTDRLSGRRGSIGLGSSKSPNEYFGHVCWQPCLQRLQHICFERNVMPVRVL